MDAVKYLCSLIILGGATLGLLLSLNDEPIFIQSLESKTIEDGPVYNKISFQKNGNKDIWMMNQSHHGPKADPEKWDRLAIIVDHAKSPKEATFLQLPPGELIWDESLMKQKINFSVSCFMCHANGPRAIRPHDKDFQLPLLSKAKVLIWNLRIKSYGLIQVNPEQKNLDANLEVPFRHPHPADNAELQVESCTQCHSGKNSWFQRNKLTRQNMISIKFMLENKIMPPSGFSVSKGDMNEIKKFIRGF